jgi:hypothetical protein
MQEDKQIFKETGRMSNFKVPEGYFESFSVKMNALIDQSETKKKRFIYGKLTLRPVLYMAAMFVVLFFSITTVLKLTTKDKQQTGLAVTGNSNAKQVITAEDYLISSIGTYAITEYYIDPEYFE